MTDDEVLAKAAEIEGRLAFIRDGQFADLLTLMVGLAAERRPELLRAALGKVFDLAAVEENTFKARQAAKAAQVELRVITEDLLKRCEKIEDRMSKAAKAFAELARRYKRLLEPTQEPAANGAAPTTARTTK